MAHCKGDIRDSFIDLFCSEDWDSLHFEWKLLGTLGKLWNCTDIVPGYCLEEIAKYVHQASTKHGFKWEEQRLSRYQGGCSYAQIVRYLKSMVCCIDGKKDFPRVERYRLYLKKQYEIAQ